jgi:hypothetical protein
VTRHRRSEPPNALGGAARVSPSRIKELAYKKDVETVGALVTAIGKAKPPAAVTSVVQAVKKNAAQVQEELDALTGPEARCTAALAARDDLNAGLTKALGRFKIHAKSAWIDEPENFQALFAPPTAVQAPKRARKPKPIAPPPSGSTPTTELKKR